MKNIRAWTKVLVVVCCFRCIQASETKPISSPELDLNRVYELVETKNYEAALDLLMSLRDQYPQYSDDQDMKQNEFEIAVFLMIAVTHHKMGNLDKAEQAYKYVIETYPETTINLGCTYIVCANPMNAYTGSAKAFALYALFFMKRDQNLRQEALSYCQRIILEYSDASYSTYDEDPGYQDLDCVDGIALLGFSHQRTIMELTNVFKKTKSRKCKAAVLKARADTQRDQKSYQKALNDYMLLINSYSDVSVPTYSSSKSFALLATLEAAKIESTYFKRYQAVNALEKKAQEIAKNIYDPEQWNETEVQEVLAGFEALKK